MTPTTHGDVPLHVVEDGPRDAPTVTLLHGLGASTRSWSEMVPLLADRYRVVRVDLPGHGRSPAPPDGRYDIDAHARRVAGALHRAGVDDTVVVGHSTGGMVATSLAEQAGHPVRALVLVDTGPGLHALTAPDITVGPEQWSGLTDDEIRGAMSAAFSRPGYVVPQELVDDVRTMPHAAFVGTLAGSHEHIRARPLPERLRTLGVPLLVLFGADDRRWRSSAAADYEVVPGARVHLLPGLGHTPILEDPPRAAAPLLAFLADLAGQEP